MITAKLIYENPQLYLFMSMYFADELSDPLFEADYAAELAQNARMAYAEYMAALVPFEADLAAALAQGLAANRL